MQIRNTKETYGVITKILHWITMILFATQYFLIYRRDYFPKDSPKKLQYILLHKSFGVTLLVTGIIFVLWRIINKKPTYPAYMKKWEQNLAKLTQYLLYLAIILMPTSGFIMSQASGRVTKWFGHITPLIFDKSEALATIAHSIHEYTGKAAMGIIALHILGAIKHIITPNDHIAKRMLH